MSVIPYSYSNFPTYRFYITYVTTTYEVFPLNFNATSLVDTQEKDNIFYRRKFSGSLLFGTNSTAIDDSGNTVNRMDNWTLLYAIEQVNSCARLDFLITKTVSGATANYWEGYFSTTDGNFDLDQCTFEVTPLPDDDYTIPLGIADTQYNILVCAAVTTTAKLGLIDQAYTRNRWLMDVIEYLANDATAGIIPGCTVSSDFFTDATNPVTLHANHLTLLTIAQKSDIIRPASSDPATTAMLSWNELMEILWAMFQVKWDYDVATDTINVEHVSWWSPAAGLDLRTQLMTQATNKYSYTKEDMPKYEKFAFMEADNANFVGLPIWYDSACVNQDPDTNVKETSIQVTTDLELIYDNMTTGAISDEGFVILCNKDVGGNYFVEFEAGLINFDVRLNMHLSWANLHNRYFRHERVLISGYMNGSLLTFWTAKKTKVQQCSAIVCSSYDPADEITTELGETYFSGAKAKVQTSSLKPSGQIDFTLLYGPADNTPTEIEDVPCALIEEDATQCGHFHITLSEAVAADSDIIVSHEILDSLGVQQCTGGPETWTVLLGESESTHTFTLCDSIPAGGCVNYAWTISDLTDAGYTIDIVTKCEC